MPPIIWQTSRSAQATFWGPLSGRRGEQGGGEVSPREWLEAGPARGADVPEVRPAGAATILVPAPPPSAPSEHPFVKSCGRISMADWLEPCPECPDVHAPVKRGHSWGSLPPRRLGFAGEAGLCLPLGCGALCRAGGAGQAHRPLRLPRRCLPTLCCPWGPTSASMATKPWIVLPENVSGSFAWSWAGGVERVVVTEEGREEGKGGFAWNPPFSLNPRDFIISGS